MNPAYMLCQSIMITWQVSHLKGRFIEVRKVGLFASIYSTLTFYSEVFLLSCLWSICLVLILNFYNVIFPVLFASEVIKHPSTFSCHTCRSWVLACHVRQSHGFDSLPALKWRPCVRCSIISAHKRPSSLPKSWICGSPLHSKYPTVTLQRRPSIVHQHLCMMGGYLYTCKFYILSTSLYLSAVCHL